MPSIKIVQKSTSPKSYFQKILKDVQTPIIEGIF